jgi:hypothetical protein
LGRTFGQQAGEICALLYHRRSPCANPATGTKMNKPGTSTEEARSWLTG